MTDDRAATSFALFRLSLWAVAGVALLVQAGGSLVHYPEASYTGTALLEDGMLSLVGSALVVWALVTGAEFFGRRSAKAAPVRLGLWLWLGVLALVGARGPELADRIWPYVLLAMALVEAGLLFRWRDPPEAAPSEPRSD